MKVICISAKAQHGKDTAASLMKTYLEANGQRVLITHYADLVKFVCTNYFGWDGNKDEHGRSLLQRVGTDVVSMQQPAFWADFIISILKFFENEWDFVLIPDCRYPVEVERMKENFDTRIIRIIRPNFESNLTIEQQQHPSETVMDTFPFDTVILNDCGFKTLLAKLECYLQYEFGI